MTVSTRAVLPLINPLDPFKERSSNGHELYSRRDDNRTRYFRGKEYALARRLERHGPLVVTQTAARGVAEIASTVERLGLDACELAALICDRQDRRRLLGVPGTTCGHETWMQAARAALKLADRRGCLVTNRELIERRIASGAT